MSTVNVDLFEHPELIPADIKAITDKWSRWEAEHGFNYHTIAKFHHELLEHGYTFESGLSAEPFGLRPVGVELHELEGYEDLKD